MVIVAVVAVALGAWVLKRPDPERRDRTPAQASATGGWVRVEPGGRTRTARGEPYAFWVRRGDTRRLMLFFQEGGGCFSYETCAPGSRFFDDAVDASDDPSSEAGVLDQRDPRNPFRDHTTVFIPSATGDVHWGDARVRYRSGSRSIEVEHRGFVNAMAAVRWAFRHVPDPDSVLVTGCSAGSVGSAAFAPYVIRHYPGARVTQLGDSLAFVFDDPLDVSDIRAYANMPRWIPAVSALRPGRHTMADYYVAIARHFPNATFAQINYANDAVQREFYTAAGGHPAHFEPDLRAALDEIRRRRPELSQLPRTGRRPLRPAPRDVPDPPPPRRVAARLDRPPRRRPAGSRRGLIVATRTTAFDQRPPRGGLDRGGARSIRRRPVRWRKNWRQARTGSPLRHEHRCWALASRIRAGLEPGIRHRPGAVLLRLLATFSTAFEVAIAEDDREESVVRVPCDRRARSRRREETGHPDQAPDDHAAGVGDGEPRARRAGRLGSRARPPCGRRPDRPVGTLSSVTAGTLQRPRICRERMSRPSVRRAALARVSSPARRVTRRSVPPGAKAPARAL